jgi:hypothetical protein
VSCSSSWCPLYLSALSISFCAIPDHSPLLSPPLPRPLPVPPLLSFCLLPFPPPQSRLTNTCCGRHRSAWRTFRSQSGTGPFHPSPLGQSWSHGPV